MTTHLASLLYDAYNPLNKGATEVSCPQLVKNLSSYHWGLLAGLSAKGSPNMQRVNIYTEGYASTNVATAEFSISALQH